MKIFIVNGFLGSGKTTLLKNVIKDLARTKLAVVVNEYGEESIDAIEYEKINLHIDQINNGSIFCSCKSDKFLDVLLDLYHQGFEQVLVESSGLSDPYALDNIIELLDKKTNHTIEEIIVLSMVDPSTFFKVFSTLVLVKRQIEVSDTIIINKLDLVSHQKILEVEDKVKEINPFAKIIKTTNAHVKYEEIEHKRYEFKRISNNRITRNLLLDSMVLSIIDNDYDKVINFIKDLNHKVYRIKGYFSHKYSIQTSYNEEIKVVESSVNYNRLVLLYNKKIITENDINEIIKRMNIKIKKFVNGAIK